MQNEAQQKLNKADENCEIKQQFFFGQLPLFCNWRKTKINFMVAPQQTIKKNKGQGFTYYIQNCQVLQYGWH